MITDGNSRSENFVPHKRTLLGQLQNLNKICRLANNNAK